MTNHKYAQCYAFKDSEDIGKVIWEKKDICKPGIECMVRISEVEGGSRETKQKSSGILCMSNASCGKDKCMLTEY
jgi:hypothetical protein